MGEENNTWNLFKNHLYSLFESNKITEKQLKHFLTRKLQIIIPKNLGLDALGSVLPEIVIGASPSFIEKMKVPYQGTSFIAANTKQDCSGPYIYKISGRPGGGVPLLTGGKRRMGDNVFASANRILLGSKAVIVSAVNLMENKKQIWNWEFFGNFLKEDHADIFDDLAKLDKIIKKNKKMAKFVVVIARSENTFKRLNIIEEYQKNNVAILDEKNDINTIFITNQKGYDYASKNIKESDTIKYIVTGEHYDEEDALIQLKKKFLIDIILNDGGIIMSNSFRDAGILPEERITLEPFPGYGIFPDEIDKNDPSCILSKEGNGIDGREVYGSVLLRSIEIHDKFSLDGVKERANVYLYPLEDKKVLY